MTVTVEQITARGGARIYRVTDDNGTRDLPSPTTILNEKAKPQVERWKMRMVATGIAMRPDLVEMALTGDKNTVQQAADQALELGRQSANKGTARHAVAEQVTSAADAFAVAAPLRPWAEAYGQLLDDHQIIVKQREIVLVNLTVGYAGTADGLCVHAGRRRIFDVKTGSAGWFDNAIQLAAYANAEFAFVDGELVPMPDDVDRELALILSVPAELDTGDPVVYGMDLDEAWDCFRALTVVKQTAGTKRGPVGVILEPTVDRRGTYRGWLNARIGWLGQHHPQVVEAFVAWHRATIPQGVELSADELELCLTTLCDLEARADVPFADDYPHPSGPLLTIPQCDEIIARLDALPRWLRAEVDEQKTKLPSVSHWRADDLADFERVLGPAESARDTLAESVNVLRDDCEAFSALAAIASHLPTPEWSWTEFEVAGSLVEAHAAGLLLVDGETVTILPTVVDRLVDRHGSKADVTKAIRARVDALGLDLKVPRAIADAATDPVLVALAA